MPSRRLKQKRTGLNESFKNISVDLSLRSALGLQLTKIHADQAGFVSPFVISVHITHPSPVITLCPWDFPGKNAGVGCHFFLQGIFLTQGLNPHLLHRQMDSWPLHHLGTDSECWCTTAALQTLISRPVTCPLDSTTCWYLSRTNGLKAVNSVNLL